MEFSNWLYTNVSDMVAEMTRIRIDSSSPSGFLSLFVSVRILHRYQRPPLYPVECPVQIPRKGSRVFDGVKDSKVKDFSVWDWRSWRVYLYDCQGKSECSGRLSHSDTWGVPYGNLKLILLGSPYISSFTSSKHVVSISTLPTMVDEIDEKQGDLLIEEKSRERGTSPLWGLIWTEGKTNHIFV